MTNTWRCPECGLTLPESGTCPGCLTDLVPGSERHHPDVTARLLTAPELTPPQRAIDHMMRDNHGVT